MPASSPVYQPTTVTYENTSPPEQWPNRPISYLSSSVSRTRRNPFVHACSPHNSILPHAVLIMGLLGVVTGIVLLVEGTVDYANTQQNENKSGDLVLAIGGGCLVVIGLLLLVVFFRTARYVRHCCKAGKDRLDTATGQALTVNPSTDLLVTAQYAPVSEVAYQPPQSVHEDTDTERSKLMPVENKDCASGEESDRMLESDPRIVLRPLNKVEDA